MFKKIKLWLVKLLLKPEDMITAIHGTHVGPCMILLTPMNYQEMSHDAELAVNCKGYTVLFYGETKQW